jgi:molybdopterin-guanine dinucleotide biosynthesis protein A
MPLVSPALLQGLHRSWLEGETGSVDVVAPIVQGIVQPMPACYASRLGAVADQLVQAGRRSLRSLFEAPAVGVRTLDEAALRRFDPDLLGLVRADTPEAWAELRDRAAHAKLALE